VTPKRKAGTAAAMPIQDKLEFKILTTNGDGGVNT
jgi:hypothetical protein